MTSDNVADPSASASRLGFDTAKAIDFLASLFPTGRVALASIVPDVQGVVGRTFDIGSDRSAMAEWIDTRQGRANIYFTLNEPRPASEQKGRAGKVAESDVVAIRGVAIDVDPKGEAEPGGAERERARLSQLASDLAAEIITPPTAIVKSGGGIQAVWLFSHPVAATEAASREVKAHARGLEQRFGSDGISNLDRLLRLPFTVNLPDERKRARGRSAALATVLHQSGERHELASLCFLAPPVELSASSAKGPVDLSEAIGVLGDPASLPPTLAEWLGIAEQRSPELRKALRQPERFTNRSSRDYAIAAACVEAGLTQVAEIASVIAAYSPGKAEDRGEPYLLSTVHNALARTAPRLDPLRWFDQDAAAAAVAVEAEAQARATEAASPRGLLTVRCRPDPSTIPTQEWLIKPRVHHATATMVVGEPAVSKSSFMLRDALIVATGREDILRGSNNACPERLHRMGPVLVYNAEDTLAEMQRRLVAAMAHHKVDDADMRYPIVLWSGVDNGALTLMHRAGRGEPLRPSPGAEALVHEIHTAGAVMVILDPIVSLAPDADENSNADMAALIALVMQVAAKTSAAIQVVQHTAKASRDNAGDMGAGRGAFATAGGARGLYTLVNVSEEDASRWDVSGRSLFRVDYGKASYSARSRDVLLFERLSVPVGNGGAPVVVGSGEETEAGALLRSQGDTAPVIAFVGVAPAGREKAEQKAAHVNAKRLNFAHAVFDVVEGVGEILIGEHFEAIGRQLNDRGATKANNRDTITKGLIFELGGAGVVIERAGQIYRVRAEKDAAHTAPWRLTVLHEEGPEARTEAATDGAAASS